MEELGLPLGPFADAALTLHQTPSSGRWHADPDCAALRRSRPREETFIQPGSGTLADRNLPELHCDFTGRLSTYVRAANDIARIATKTVELRESVASRKRLLDALEAPFNPFSASMNPDDAAALQPAWDSALGARRIVAEDAAKHLRDDDDAFSISVIAAWVLSGRTPGQHAHRYAAFEHALSDLADNAAVRLRKPDLNGEDLLPTWLYEVSLGTDPDRASKDLLEAQLSDGRWAGGADHDEQRETWRSVVKIVTRLWTGYLAAIRTAHPHRVLAIYSMANLPAYARTLGAANLATFGGAEIKTGDLHWVVASAPAAFRLPIGWDSHRYGGHGVSGLVLLEYSAREYTPAKCAELLRRVLANEGFEAAGRLVSSVEPGLPKPVHFDNDEDNPVPTPAWPRSNFADASTGRGLTLGDVVPLLEPTL